MAVGKLSEFMTCFKGLRPAAGFVVFNMGKNLSVNY